MRWAGCRVWWGVGEGLFDKGDNPPDWFLQGGIPIAENHEKWISERSCCKKLLDHAPDDRLRFLLHLCDKFHVLFLP